MRRRVGLVGLCCVLLANSSSWAATVEPGPGPGVTSINQGRGFQLIFSTVQGNTGDSVMVGPGGSATITYKDGCKQEVKPGAVVTIQEDPSPCAAGAFAQSPDPGFWVAAGGAAIGAGFAICAAIQDCLSSNNTNNKPLSP